MNELIKSTPSTIKNKLNFIKKYINSRGFDYNTDCLDVLLSKSNNNISKYVNFLGDYNYIQSTPMKDQKKITYTDYTQYCPDGWERINGGCAAPEDYKGKCDSGRIMSDEGCLELLEDTSTKLNLFSFSQKNNFISKCGSKKNTTSPANFDNYTPLMKQKWSEFCGANWPEKNRVENCYTGRSISDDIKAGRVIKIGEANSIMDAAKLAIKKGYKNFAMIDNIVYVSDNNYVFISKNKYEKDCDGKYKNNKLIMENKIVKLYEIIPDFWNELERCKRVNDSINSINNSITKLSSNDIYESFSANQQQDIIQNNLNEIVKNLAEDYNKKAKLYNLQADVINRHDNLVKHNKEKITKQLDTLDDIQNQIAVKERVSELNNKVAEKQRVNKKILYGFYVLLPFLILALILVVVGVMGTASGLVVGGIFILSYIVYALVILNRNREKVYDKPFVKTVTKYENALKRYWDKEKAKISKNLSDYVYGDCNCPPEEELTPIPPKKYPKGDFMMNANGPFYYYDGSAPPQQIMPKPQGSIQFVVDGEEIEFPREVKEKLDKIKDPIVKIFFELWLTMLEKKGISVDDPRFNEKLDVVDFEIGNKTMPPFWDHIKLPMVTNLQQNVGNVCQKYNKIRVEKGNNAATFLVDMWNYVYNDNIPQNIYEEWLKKINKCVLDKGNVENLYRNYFNYLIKLDRFMQKYNSVDQFMIIKIRDFIRVMNEDVAFSQPVVKKVLLQ